MAAVRFHGEANDRPEAEHLCRQRQCRIVFEVLRYGDDLLVDREALDHHAGMFAVKNSQKHVAVLAGVGHGRGGSSVSKVRHDLLADPARHRAFVDNGVARSCALAAPRDEAQMQEDHFFGGGPLGGRGRELKAMGPWRVLDNRRV